MDVEFGRMAPGTDDLCAMCTTTECTMYVKHAKHFLTVHTCTYAGGVVGGAVVFSSFRFVILHRLPLPRASFLGRLVRGSKPEECNWSSQPLQIQVHHTKKCSKDQLD